jgi:hypothetical protein
MNTTHRSTKLTVAVVVCMLAAPEIFSSNSQVRSKPAITRAVLFNTPEADRILSGLQVFPPDNPWNQDISSMPLHSNSDAIVGTIGKDKHVAYNLDMNFVIVPPDQPRVPVRIIEYARQSDPGPFPVPDNLPIENWPMRHNEDQTALPRPGAPLDEIQKVGQGDRHAIIVDPMNGILYEFYQARRTPSGWQAAQSSIFDLNSNRLRPSGWTSSDAAGLPIFPAIVRYDECESGIVKHAMRVTVQRTGRAFIFPARHYASSRTEPNLPRMGERLRLRANYDVSSFPPHVKAILRGLKKYGMFVADNGSNWYLSIAPDSRLKGLESLAKLRGSDFEVVDTSHIVK